ncbi:MAG: hypothetical protein Q8N01_05990 [Sulfuricurvum sp.]|nr:hypothetical protein [Sulfuricurvum sp.]
MLISSKDFFSSLSVDVRYYKKIFLSLGVKSTFFYDYDDLNIIINNVRRDRYKSLLVLQRAKNILDDLEAKK